MRQILELKIDINNLKKPQLKLGLFILIILLSLNTNLFAKHEGLEERLYNQMTNFNVKRATENYSWIRKVEEYLMAAN